MKKLLFLPALLVLLFAACDDEPETQTTPGGVEYVLVHDEEGEPMKQGDIVTFHFTQMLNDSLLMSSYDMGEPAIDQVRESQGYGDLYDWLTILSEGDSAIFYLETDSLLATSQPGQLPEFIKPGEQITFHLKILNVQTEQEYAQEREQAGQQQMGTDDQLIQGYLADAGVEAQKTENGLYYKIDEQGSGAKPQPGDTVRVNYTGKLLNGTVFDTSHEDVAEEAGVLNPNRTYEPLEFTLGMGMVIPGWDQGIMLFNEGGKGTLYIPSHLAYGERGAGANIPPNSVLVFDIELVEVK